MKAGRALREKWAMDAAAAKLCACGHEMGVHREKGYASEIVNDEIVWTAHPDHAAGVFFCGVDGCDCRLDLSESESRKEKGMKKMRAKYAGTCSECGGHVAVGDTVYWKKGEGVKHADAEVCGDAFDYDAEQRAEMRFEMGCAAHMAGTAYVHREQGFDQL